MAQQKYLSISISPKEEFSNMFGHNGNIAPGQLYVCTSRYSELLHRMHAKKICVEISAIPHISSDDYYTILGIDKLILPSVSLSLHCVNRGNHLFELNYTLLEEKESKFREDELFRHYSVEFRVPKLGRTFYDAEEDCIDIQIQQVLERQRLDEDLFG
jgi:hypothetical protein